MLKRFVDLILYGNFWIAAAALVMGLQTQYLLLGKILWSPVLFFLFGAVLFIYALHRVIGLKGTAEFKESGRYQIIHHFYQHIFIYALLGLGISLYFFLQFSTALYLCLIPPVAMTAAYIFPFFGKGRRLRDFHFVKIFLIAISWAWGTVLLPATEVHMDQQIPTLLMVLERGLFLFAITIPFDIRDLQLDQHQNVKTIPKLVGVRKSIQLSLICLIVMFGLVYLNYQLDVYALSNLLAFSISIISTAIFILFSGKVDEDYYFTGLLDGTMVFQFLLIYFIG